MIRTLAGRADPAGVPRKAVELWLEVGKSWEVLACWAREAEVETRNKRSDQDCKVGGDVKDLGTINRPVACAEAWVAGDGG